MALLWEYIRTVFQETIPLWKKGDAVTKFAAILGTGVLSAAVSFGYQVSLTSQAGTVIATGIALWAGLAFFVFTPYRMWRAQRLRVIELETVAKSARTIELDREIVWSAVIEGIELRDEGIVTHRPSFWRTKCLAWQVSTIDAVAHIAPNLA